MPRKFASVPVVLDVCHRRVLKVLLCSKNCLCSVWVVGEEDAVHSLERLSEVVCEGHVLLLVYSLELGVETAYHRVHEAVSLDASPVLDLV